MKNFRFWVDPTFNDAITQSKALFEMLEKLVYIKCNLIISKKIFIVFEVIKVEYSFANPILFGLGLEPWVPKFAGLPLGLGLGKLSDLDLGLGLDVCSLDHITVIKDIFSCCLRHRSV